MQSQPSKRRRVEAPSLSASLPGSTTRAATSPAASTSGPPSRRPSDALASVPTPSAPGRGAAPATTPSWPSDPYARYHAPAASGSGSSVPPPAPGLRRAATFEPGRSAPANPNSGGHGTSTPLPDFSWLTGAPPRTYQPPPTTQPSLRPPPALLPSRDPTSLFGLPPSTLADAGPSFYTTSVPETDGASYAWAQQTYDYGATATPAMFGSTSQAEAAQSLFALAGQR